MDAEGGASSGAAGVLQNSAPDKIPAVLRDSGDKRYNQGKQGNDELLSADWDKQGAGGDIDGMPKAGLNNVDARKWYLAQEQKIAGQIDTTLPIKDQAKQAFNLRNQYRTQARELMSDQTLAKSLNKTDPNLTWNEAVQKQIDKGFSGDDIYVKIVDSSQRSRTSVNQSLGLK